MRINESMKVIDMLWERREHLRNEGEDGLRASESWCAYAAEGGISADTVVLIAEPVRRDEKSGAEILPQRAQEQGRLTAISAQTVDDAVICAVREDGAVSKEALAGALIASLTNAGSES